LVRGNGAASTIITATSAPTPGVPHILYAAMAGNNVAHFLDGVANGTGVITTAIADDSSKALGIGTRDDFGTKMNGSFAELLIFGSALSDADRLAMDNYLSVKYGIAVGSLPRLSVASPSGGSFQLSWPTPSVPFALESATNLITPVWIPVSNVVASSGGTNSVTITETNNLQFFRLRKQ
jgi:hypothetical protein